MQHHQRQHHRQLHKLKWHQQLLPVHLKALVCGTPKGGGVGRPFAATQRTAIAPTAPKCGSGTATFATGARTR
eukprot:2443867-Amphidinium_carterae.1